MADIMERRFDELNEFNMAEAGAARTIAENVQIQPAYLPLAGHGRARAGHGARVRHPACTVVALLSKCCHLHGMASTEGCARQPARIEPNAIELSGDRGRRMLLAEGYDLAMILDGRIRFDDLRRRKKQHPACTGQNLLRAADVIG